jgi:hypothetical protein
MTTDEFCKHRDFEKNARNARWETYCRIATWKSAVSSDPSLVHGEIKKAGGFPVAGALNNPVKRHQPSSHPRSDPHQSAIYRPLPIHLIYLFFVSCIARTPYRPSFDP